MGYRVEPGRVNNDDCLFGGVRVDGAAGWCTLRVDGWVDYSGSRSLRSLSRIARSLRLIIHEITTFGIWCATSR